MIKPIVHIGVSALLLAVMSACGGSDGESTQVTTKMGALSIGVTDAPIDDAQQVVVVFTEIELKPKEGESFTLYYVDENGDPDPQEIDLLAYQNGEAAPLIQDEEVLAGEYTWMRLGVEAERGVVDSYIVLEENGAQHSLYVPSGSNTGLKVNESFIVTAGGNTALTIDFDLRKSVHEPGNNADDYILRPTLRITDNSEVGDISGYISSSLLLEEESCEIGSEGEAQGLAVYVYTNGNIDVVVDPNDEGSDNSPLATTIPVYDSVTDQYNYSLAFMLAGDYNVAVTCDADVDDVDVDEPSEDNPDTPEVEETWISIADQNATVNVGETTEVNFEPST